MPKTWIFECVLCASPCFCLPLQIRHFFSLPSGVPVSPATLWFPPRAPVVLDPAATHDLPLPRWDLSMWAAGLRRVRHLECRVMFVPEWPGCCLRAEFFSAAHLAQYLASIFNPTCSPLSVLFSTNDLFSSLLSDLQLSLDSETVASVSTKALIARLNKSLSGLVWRFGGRVGG